MFLSQSLRELRDNTRGQGDIRAFNLGGRRGKKKEGRKEKRKEKKRKEKKRKEKKRKEKKRKERKKKKKKKRGGERTNVDSTRTSKSLHNRKKAISGQLRGFISDGVVNLFILFQKERIK